MVLVDTDSEIVFDVFEILEFCKTFTLLSWTNELTKIYVVYKKIS